MLWIMIAVAVIPPLLLMVFINSRDKHEKEPVGLLVKCAIFGALSVIFSIVMEMITLPMIQEAFYGRAGILMYFLEAFLGIAVVEETGKYIMLRLGTWKNPNFNYTFDGIVYSVYVSLGFALVENIVYVIQNGMETGFIRAVTAIPGHASFGVYMGYYYGLAKFWEVAGNKGKCRGNLWTGWLVAVLLHGFYDFCALSGKEGLLILFFVFIVAMDIAVVVQIVKSSKHDTPIYRTYQNTMYQVSFRQAYQNPYGTQQPQYLQYQYGNPMQMYLNHMPVNGPNYMPGNGPNRMPMNPNHMPVNGPNQMSGNGPNRMPVNPNPYAGMNGNITIYTGGAQYKNSEAVTDQLYGDGSDQNRSDENRW